MMNLIVSLTVSRWSMSSVFMFSYSQNAKPICGRYASCYSCLWSVCL